MNVLIINLTRFGDLLQTQAAITDLVRRGDRVGLVCLENFAGAAALLQGLSHVAALPGAAFLASLDERARRAQMNREAGENGPELTLPEGELSWAAAPARLFAWREALETAFTPDEICNLTPSLSARLLARFLARQKKVTGFGIDDQGFGYNSSPWAAFLMGAAAARGLSPFNVVDLFRRAALDGKGLHLAGDASLHLPDEDVIRAMQERLRKKAPEQSKGFVALQLGASEERRRWPVANFAALGDMLWQKMGLCPVLLGSAGEKRLAERYAELATSPFIPLCGETSLPELAATLCISRLLATNDTGTMHLAAGLGIPVLSIFLATAQPFDTGPYAAGSVAVEPGMPCHPCAFGSACPIEHQCRHAVTPQAMYPLAEALLTGKRPEAPPIHCAAEGSCEPENGGRVWLSTFDEAGFISLVSVSGHDREDRTQWFMAQRHVLRQFLDRSGDFSSGPQADRVTLSDEGRAEISADLAESAALVKLVEELGKMLLIKPMQPLREKFMTAWNRVLTRLRQSPRLGALGMLWLEETQAEGQDFPVTIAVIGQFALLLDALKNKINE